MSGTAHEGRLGEGALRELLGDHERRAALALAARRRAIERYSVERMVRDYAEVVEALGEGRGKRG